MDETTPSSRPSSGSPGDRPWTRVYFIVAGAVVSLLAVTALILASMARAMEPERGAGPLVFGFVFVAVVGTVGLRLVRRGIRGRERAMTPSVPDKEIRRRYQGLVVLGTAAVVAVALSIYEGDARLSASPRIVRELTWFCSVLVLAIPAHVLVHELGHAAAAIAGGLRIATIRVGGLVLARTQGGWRLSWDWSPIPNMLGLAQIEPEQQIRASRGALAFFAAGGPIATVTATCLCWAAGGSPFLRLSSQGLAALQAGTLAGVLLAIGNLLPLRRGRFTNDGARLTALVRARASGEELARRLVSQSLRHRPRDWGWSAQELMQAAEKEPPELKELILIHALAVARDSGHGDLASELCRTSLETFQPNSRWRLDLELQGVLEAALLRRDPSSARRQLRGCVPGPTVDPDYLLLAEAAVCLAEGRFELAQDALHRWLAGAERHQSTSVWNIGNHWAIEAVEAGVAAGGQPGPGSPRL